MAGVKLRDTGVGMGKLVGIAVRSKSRAPMQKLDAAQITTQQGVAGDFRGRPGARQVTLMSNEAWSKACALLDRQVDWTVRRANLLVEGTGTGRYRGAPATHG